MGKIIDSETNRSWETTFFGLSYQDFLEIESSRNQDSTVGNYNKIIVIFVEVHFKQEAQFYFLVLQEEMYSCDVH